MFSSDARTGGVRVTFPVIICSVVCIENGELLFSLFGRLKCSMNRLHVISFYISLFGLSSARFKSLVLFSLKYRVVFSCKNAINIIRIGTAPLLVLVLSLIVNSEKTESSYQRSVIKSISK